MHRHAQISPVGIVSCSSCDFVLVQFCQANFSFFLRFNLSHVSFSNYFDVPRLRFTIVTSVYNSRTNFSRLNPSSERTTNATISCTFNWHFFVCARISEERKNTYLNICLLFFFRLVTSTNEYNMATTVKSRIDRSRSSLWDSSRS